MTQPPRKIYTLQTTQAPALVPADTGIDPHVKLAEIYMSEHATTIAPEPRKQKNLTTVEMTQSITRKNRVALVVAPEWSPLAPPYGIARMAAISRHSGFDTQCWDINILAKHEAGCPEYWTAYEDWKWTEPHYSENIHPKIESTLFKYIDEIVAWSPTVIGFSSWYTNDTCTVWMARELRARLPGITIIIGGANATQLKVSDTSVADHIVSGEGELWFVRILENLENPTETIPHICIQSKDQRVDLDSMPPADYADFDLTLYDSGGISCEFSRGCIANCVYCNETIFWKFRARQSSRVLEEIEIAYRTKGIKAAWFIDSLLNGNLKELRAFAEGLIEKKIKINWTGYSRIDGKMDIEFWRLLKQSGASGFAFGVESGSQKVLDLMKKNCKVESIEQNFRDLREINLYSNFATWFTGFPGEELTDIAQTMTLIWRLRNSGMGNQSSGTCGLGHGTPLDVERERFGVSSQDWSYGWVTADMRNTGFHRFIRFKCTNILLEQFRLHSTHKEYERHYQYPTLKNHYNLEFAFTEWVDNIPWEKDFDYEIIKTDINPVANTLVNEIWPLLRVLWLGAGSFKFHLEFDPDQDLADFGYLRYPRGGEHRYWARYDFEIDAQGQWIADFNIRLQADPYNGQPTDFHFEWKNSGTWTRPSIVDNS
jgi:anaerobic magnesium-protoporphyrin IX monomethyl ester cyclase